MSWQNIKWTKYTACPRKAALEAIQSSRTTLGRFWDIFITQLEVLLGNALDIVSFNEGQTTR